MRKHGNLEINRVRPRMASFVCVRTRAGPRAFGRSRRRGGGMLLAKVFRSHVPRVRGRGARGRRVVGAWSARPLSGFGGL